MDNKAVVDALHTLMDNLGDIKVSDLIEKLKDEPKTDSNYFEIGERYFIIAADGSFAMFDHIGSVWDNGVNRMRSGYRTREDAEKAKARQLAIVRVNRLIEEANSKYQAGKMKGNDGHYIYYHIYHMEFYVGGSFHCSTLDSRTLISCNDSIELKRIIKENESDLKLIFEIG